MLSMMALSNSNRDYKLLLWCCRAIMIGAVYVDGLIVHGRPPAL